MLCLISSFVGCGAKRLPTPANYLIDPDLLILNWDKNDDADGYIVEINGEENELRKNYYDLSELPEGNYQVRIKARGDGKYFKDSKWTEKIPFKKDKEAPLQYALINGKTEYEVVGVGSAVGDVVIYDSYRGKPVTSIGDTAFSNSIRITSVQLPNTITKIGTRAFYNCKKLESINIPESVTIMGDNVFQYCEKLKSITLPSAITKVNQYMFSRCTALESFEFKGAVTTIGENAFADCQSLKEIILPDTVTSLSQYAFSGCTAVTKIDTGDNVVELGDYAFHKCSAVSNVSLSEKLNKIGRNVFSDCDSLTSITIPDGVTEIPLYAFYDSEKLNEVNFGDVVSIGEFAFYGTKMWEEAEDGILYVDDWLVTVKAEAYKNTVFDIKDGTVGIATQAFYKCNSFINLFIPNSVKYIGTKAFYGCKSLYSVSFGYRVDSNGEYDPDGEVPDEGIISIGEYAFNGCADLTNVFFVGQKLEEIGSYCFATCPILSIDLPDSVKKIGTYAFYGTGLWEATASGMPVFADDWVVGVKNANQKTGEITVKKIGGVTGVSDYAFWDCINVTAVYLPDTIEYIGYAAFAECLSLKLVDIPDSVEVIEDFTFYKCENLASVNLPHGLKRIGVSAFYKCLALDGGEDGFQIPNTVEYIDQYAFFGCENLKSIKILESPDIPLEIGYRAFQDCKGLESLYVSDRVTSLNTHTFYNCTSLKNLTLGSGLSEIGTYTFFGCVALEQVSIPDNIKYIGKYAFRNCTELKVVDLGSVEKIDDYAFYASGLTNVILPESLKTLGNYVFRNNLELTSIIIPKTLENLGKHSFYGCTNLTLYVEDSSAKETWENYWNSYFRPVVWNVKLSSDKSYVESFVVTKGCFENHDAKNGTKGPVRMGKTFMGWSTVSSDATTADYTEANVHTAPEGTVLFSLWN